jgi:site-specific DNA-methyltransferase (adenine-specific)
MIKLIHGDCLEKMAEIEDGSVDMVLTDPPYGTTACKWDSIIPLEPMWAHLKRLAKKNAAIVMTASQPFTTTLIASNMKMFRYEWIWHKNFGSNFAVARKQAFKEHENVCVFYCRQPNYNPQMEQRSESGKAMVRSRDYSVRRSEHSDMGSGKANRDPDLRLPGSVRKINNERGLHPTQKPVALMEYLIKTYTNEGETVLDFTMGSGTTGVACVNLNRSFIGIEKDAEYFQLATDRIHSHNTKHTQH